MGQTHRLVTRVLLAAFVLAVVSAVLVEAAGGKKKKVLSDRELDKLVHEQDREEYEEIMSARKPSGKFKEEPIDFKKADPLKLLSRSKGGKPLMVIVNLLNPTDRNSAEELGIAWNSSLKQAMLKAQVYVIDETKVLFYFDDGSDVIRARSFLLALPQVESIEYDSQKYYPNDQEPPKNPKSEL